ncbi:Extensin repeat-containing protein [Balamuthia mandrillaris]
MDATSLSAEDLQTLRERDGHPQKMRTPKLPLHNSTSPSRSPRSPRSHTSSPRTPHPVASTPSPRTHPQPSSPSSPSSRSPRLSTARSHSTSTLSKSAHSSPRSHYTSPPSPHSIPRSHPESPIIRRKSETDELRKSKLAARLPSSNGNKKKKKKEKEKQELIASSSSVTSVVGARRRSSSVKQFTKTDMLPALDAPARQRAFSHTPKPQSMPRLHSSYSPRTNRKPAGGSNGGEDGEPQPTEGVPKHRRLLRSMSSRRGVLCSSSSNLPARPVHRSHKDKAKTKDQAKAKDQEEKRKKKKKKSGKKKKKETTSKTRPRGVSLDQKNRSYQEAAKEEEQERDSAQESSLSAKEERKLRELLRQEKKEIRRCKRERAKWKKVLQEEQRRGTAAEKILSNLYQPNTDNKLLQYFQSRTNLLDEASADFVLEQATSIGSNTDKKSKEQLSSSGSVEAETVTTTSSADELQELLQSLEIDKELMKELRNLRSQEELENLSDAQLRKLKFKYLAESQLKRSQVRKAKGGGPALGTFSSSIARTKGDNSNQQKTSGGNITDSSKSLKLSQFFKRKNSQTDSHQGGASPKLSRHPYHDKTTLDELPEDRAWGEKDGESSSLSSSPSSSSSSPSSSILSASTSFLSKGDAGREAANHEQATWQRSTASSSGSSIQTASQTDSPNQPQHSNNNSYAEFSASSGQHRLRSSHRVRLNSLATQRDISRSPRTTSTNFSLEQKQHQASHPAQQDESEKERANKGGPQGEIDKEQKMDTESKINYYLLRAKELITQNYELRSKIQEMVVQTNILKTYLSNDHSRVFNRRGQCCYFGEDETNFTTETIRRSDIAPTQQLVLRPKFHLTLFPTV